jgi:type II secretory pathway component PulC
MPQPLATAFILLGLIDSGSPATSVAVFGSQDGSVFLREGQVFLGYRIAKIRDGGALLEKRGSSYFIKPGQYLEDAPENIKITSGIEIQDNKILVTETLRDYLDKEGLIAALMQAASEMVEQGIKLFDIDRGSIYDLAGLENGDIIQEIDGVPLTSPFTALRLANSIRRSPEFKFKYSRAGVEHTMKVVVR